MSVTTKLKFTKLVADLNELVERHGSGSALQGLTVVAHGFAALLDVYAMPNAGNPEGMCDDKQAFRTHFAEMIQTAPEVKMKIPAKKGGGR